MLILFDIDGTLLTGAATDHAAALYDALRDVYGVEDPEGAHVEAAGRTDVEIARAILLLRDVDAATIDDRLDDLRAAACARFAERCPPTLADRVIPGAAELLNWIDAGTTLSLVTGNLEPIARLKLARAGIGHHFAAGQGGFGSDSEDRTDLPAIARARAGRLAGMAGAHPREDTLVIGDTPRDIACARADGLRCIAVATGPYDAAQLAQADAVAENMAELRQLLRTSRL